MKINKKKLMRGIALVLNSVIIDKPDPGSLVPDEVFTRTKQHEKFSSKLYLCPISNQLHIGYGRNIESNPLRKNEAEYMLRQDLDTAYTQLVAWIPKTKELSRARFGVLLEMTYQMGVDGLLKFSEMLKCLHKDDHTGVVREMLDSLWAKEQTPERAKTLARIYQLDGAELE